MNFSFNHNLIMKYPASSFYADIITDEGRSDLAKLDSYADEN